MKPGRELDALVAEKVMGWKEVNLNGSGIPPHLKPPYLGMYDLYSDYSTDIAAAWEVIKQVCQEGYPWEPFKGLFDDSNNMDQLPYLICLAALKSAQAK